MTPDEEVKMLNEDHEIWKQAHEHARKCSVPNICDVPGIDIDSQLEQIIMNYRSLSNMNAYKMTTFSSTAPLYVDGDRSIPMCTTDDELAKLWVLQINEKLQSSRDGVIYELIKQSSTKGDLQARLNGMYSARCIDMYIDPVIGERDKQIAGMHYIGVVVSHYNSERTNNLKHVKHCEAMFNSLRSTSYEEEDQN